MASWSVSFSIQMADGWEERPVLLMMRYFGIASSGPCAGTLARHARSGDAIAVQQVAAAPISSACRPLLWREWESSLRASTSSERLAQQMPHARHQRWLTESHAARRVPSGTVARRALAGQPLSFPHP
jgi:hypothetical protein